MVAIKSRKPVNSGKNLPGRAVSLQEAWGLITCSGQSLSGQRNSAFVALCFGAGLRCAEALAVRPSDIESGPGGVTITVNCGKGGQSRRSVMLPDFAVVVDRWLERRGVLGITRRSPVICGVTLGETRGNLGNPISTAQMRGTIARMAKKANLSHRIHVHGLRHGHATLLAERGLELRIISSQLGHSNCAVTDRYLAKLSPVELISAIGQLNTANRREL